MAELTPQELQNQADNNLPNNDQNLISPEDVRTQNKDIVDSMLSYQDLAWGNYQDSEYTVSSPLVVNSLIAPKLYQINKQALNKEFRPKSITLPLWDSVGDNIVIPEIDRDIEIYLYFRGSADQNNRNLFMELYIPNEDIILDGNPIPFPRGADSPHVEYFVGTTTQGIVDNGIQIRLYSDGIINVYNMGIRVKLGKKANI
jgi:hypothetical protein